MRRMVWMALPLFIACGDAKTGSHIGNPVSINFTVRKSLEGQPNLTLTDETGRVYTLEVARMNLDEVRVGLPPGVGCDEVPADELVGGTCRDEVESSHIRISGPFVVDLLTGSAPGLNEVRLPALEYSRVEYRVEDADVEDGRIAAGDPLEDLSMLVVARFDDGEGPNTLELRLKFNEEMRTEATAGASLVTASALSVTFDTQSWLSQAGLGECVSSSDPGPVIVDDDSSCDGVEDAVKENIKGSDELEGDHYDDDDGASSRPSA